MGLVDEFALLLVNVKGFFLGGGLGRGTEGTY